MSYNFGYKSFDFSLNASAMLNWSREQRFQSVNWQNDQVSKMESSNNLFGLGLNAGLKVYYPLSNHFKVFVMPGVQSYNMSGVKSSYSHNESVFAKQVQVGIRYSVF
jgi:archaeosine-15-forming tRNA-guanine transglycosylase